MEVYRVENESHRGPYNAGEAYHPDTGDQPTPWCDRRLSRHWDKVNAQNIESQYLFGFGTLDQLRKWFNDPAWLNEAEEEGFRLAVYDVDPQPFMYERPFDERKLLVDAVLPGDNQLCFWKDSARLVRTAPLSSIY